MCGNKKLTIILALFDSRLDWAADFFYVCKKIGTEREQTLKIP